MANYGGGLEHSAADTQGSCAGRSEQVRDCLGFVTHWFVDEVGTEQQPPPQHLPGKSGSEYASA